MSTMTPVIFAKQHFGSHVVHNWHQLLFDHAKSRQTHTAFEQALNTSERRAKKIYDPERRAKQLLEHVCHQFFWRLSGKPKGEIPYEILARQEYLKPQMVFRPSAVATVTYQGETIIAIECEVWKNNKPRIKPTVLFVSHPFHQFKMIRIA